MLQEKDWKEMLAELQAELEQDEKEERADNERAWGWRGRIREIFNSKSANRLLPRISNASRDEQEHLSSQGIALVNEIMEKILKKELSAQELNYIHAEVRSLVPEDRLMHGLLQPLAFAAHTAFELVKDEQNAVLRARSAAVDRKEIAILRRYLEQNPHSAEILLAMMPVNHRIESIETISQRLGRPLTKDQLQSLADEVNPIIGNNHNIRPVTVRQMLKPEFEDLPASDLQDEHFNMYFSMGGSTEVQAVVKEYAVVQKNSPPDTPSP